MGVTSIGHEDKDRGKAAAIVGQYVREPEGEGGVGFTQEGDGTLLGFTVFHGQMR